MILCTIGLHNYVWNRDKEYKTITKRETHKLGPFDPSIHYRHFHEVICIRCGHTTWEEDEGYC